MYKILLGGSIASSRSNLATTSSHARLEITVHCTDNPSIGHIRIRIQGKNFEIVYSVDVACSFYLYLVLRRSVVMKGQYIFRTHFSYFCLSRKCGNIHTT